MKIKITEAQARRLNLLKESNDPVVVLNNYLTKSKQTLNKIFNELTDKTLKEINEINFDLINSTINTIEKESSILYKKVEVLIDDASNNSRWDDYDRLTDKLNPEWDDFNSKLTTIEDLLYKLNQLHEYFIEKDVMSNFEPLDITDIQ
jgi:uncharacterized protein YoxC